MTDAIYKIPPVSEVDFSNVDAISGYQLLLCTIFEREGGFQLPLVMNQSIREVQTQGLIWLSKTKALIDNILSGKCLQLSAIPTLLDSYDVLFRVCNGKDESDYIRTIRLTTVDRWLKGNSSISRTDIVLELLKEVNRDNRTLDNKYSLYALKISGEWIDELARLGRFKDIPLTEAYRRLTSLLCDDLFAYLGSNGQIEHKNRWIKAYTLTETELTSLDTPTLQAYINFAQAAAFFKGQSLQFREDQYRRLISILTSHPDFHHYHRQALSFPLDKYNAKTA